MRVTDQIVLPGGDRAVFTKPGPAVTLSYPPVNAIRASLVQTASATLASCAWSETILQELPIMPFSEDEVQKLTSQPKSRRPVLCRCDNPISTYSVCLLQLLDCGLQSAIEANCQRGFLGR